MSQDNLFDNKVIDLDSRVQFEASKTYSEPFTVIYNELLQCTDISPQAFRIICYLISLPSDWVAYRGQLEKQLKISREGIKKAFLELEDLGYLSVTKIKDNYGKFCGWKTIWSKIPEFKKTKTLVDNSTSEKNIKKTKASGSPESPALCRVTEIRRSATSSRHTGSRTSGIPSTTKEIYTTKETNNIKTTTTLPDPSKPEAPSMDDVVLKFFENEKFNDFDRDWFRHYDNNFLVETLKAYLQWASNRNISSHVAGFRRACLQKWKPNPGRETQKQPSRSTPNPLEKETQQRISKQDSHKKASKIPEEFKSLSSRLKDELSKKD